MRENDSSKKKNICMEKNQSFKLSASAIYLLDMYTYIRKTLETEYK
jgi:hypothetical protein